MKILHRSVCLLVFTLLFNGLWAQNNNKNKPTRIAFYNVENLFDLKDDPTKLDEDFTPGGKQEWTNERYQTKLDRIHEVTAGMEYPAVLGLCEVENATVLNDLSEFKGMKEHKYRFVHFESPDRRGIDVALMYQKKRFKVKNSSYLRIDFPDAIVPDEPGYTSRDILIVEGKLNKKNKVIVMVAHFPSRYGGVAKSEPKRLHVARFLRKKVNELKAQRPDAQIIIMGDFNDEPTNKSIARTLQTYPLPSKSDPLNLYNCFSDLDKAGEGSYNYKGDWNMLDQILLSGHFFQPNNRLRFQSAHIFKGDFLFYEDKKYGKRPSRTYGGPRYFGGYSDHLPVYIEFQ